MKMRKRFFASMALLTAVSLIVLAILLGIVFYYQLLAVVQDEVRDRALILRGILNAGTPYSDLQLGDMNVSIISADGTVIYSDAPVEAERTDSSGSVAPAETVVPAETASFAETVSIANREEIVQALSSGTGESKRYSDTLRQEVYYYAVLLDDGTVLCLAKTTRSAWSLFSESLPVVVFVVSGLLIAQYLLAKGLARKLVEPISKVNLKEGLSAPYDEFAPFVRELERQETRIAKHKADLQKRSDTITAIMDNMSEGVVLVDCSETVAAINPSAAQIFGVEADWNGRNVLEIVRDVDLLKNVRLALSGSPGEMHLEQGTRVYQVLLSPAKDRGAILLFLDVTDKALAEKQRKDFSANVSHELKTPLTTIYGHAEMLSSGMVNENDKPQFYGRIKDEAARMIALVDNIIKISLLDEGGSPESAEDVDLMASASEAIKCLKEKAEAHSVELILEGESVSIDGSRHQIFELFFNLVDNAIGYNVPGGRVRVAISRDDLQAKIIIADTGIGVPQEALGRVFERFFRVDPSRSKKTGGTGLGLAIVKHIVSAHQGIIVLQSQEQKSGIHPGRAEAPVGDTQAGDTQAGDALTENTVVTVLIPLVLCNT
jgi:two-component system phosphate regulon sensor histidine kinase PhoR